MEDQVVDQAVQIHHLKEVVLAIQPPVSPPQGNNGGPGAQTSGLGGGGGGATAAGTQYPGSGTHPGGAGAGQQA